MSEPVILRNSLAIALIAVLQTIVPAVIAVGALYAVLTLYGVRLDESYHSMAVIVGLLALLLPRPPRTLQSQLLSASIPIALSVVVRWMALLAALLAIGYLTKFSGHYSRRAMLTWAALGPVLIIVATLALHELTRRYCLHPSNARKTVLAGCTPSSLALGRRLGRCSEFGMAVVGFFDDRERERLKVDPELDCSASSRTWPSTYGHTISR